MGFALKYSYLKIVAVPDVFFRGNKSSKIPDTFWRHSDHPQISDISGKVQKIGYPMYDY